MRKQSFWILFCTLAIGGEVLAQPIVPVDRGATPVASLCPHTVVYEGGVADDFGGGPDVVSLSPALASFVTGHATKKYDETACDTFVADSFSVGRCQICETACSAEIEVTYQSCGATLSCNDTITIGTAPFGAGGVVLATELLYPPGCDDPVGPGEPLPNLFLRAFPSPPPPPPPPSGKYVKRIAIPAWALQNLCATGSSFSIDWVVQDDTIVDSIKLIVHY